MPGLRTLDLPDLDRQARQAAGPVIAQITAADLGRPTSCAAGNLANAAASGEREPRLRREHGGHPYRPVHLDSGVFGTDPHCAYQDSATAVAAAFAAPDGYDHQIEVREFSTFPGRVAVSMHFVDVLVHGRDVAVSIGVPYRPDDEVAATAPDFERLLGLLGRSPTWFPPC